MPRGKVTSRMKADWAKVCEGANTNIGMAFPDKAKIAALEAENERLTTLLESGLKDMDVAAARLTERLEDVDWRPSRSHIEADRNLFRAVAGAMRGAR